MLQIKFTSVLRFMVWRGIVLAVLWGWFMVPIGAPTVSNYLATGQVF